jgi:hypothetical protein
MEKDDDFWDDDYTDWAFHSLLCELEANGEILKQWESGAPIDNAPQQNKNQKNYEKRTI